MDYVALSGSVEVPSGRQSLLAEVSDTLLFDFLVDDHDRSFAKNWIRDNSHLLLWDSGLGWNHGPHGHSTCKSILCGRM